MKLIVYSAKKFSLDFGKKYPIDRDGMKPCGLWVSVEGENDWLWWCRAEGFRLQDLRYSTQIVLKPDAKIMLIENVEMFDAFNSRYKKAMYPGSRMDCIDWALVKVHYDGIIIAPYLWQRRMDHDCFWYYGWDCASGCIWNLDCIAGGVHLGLTPAEEAQGADA